MKNKILTIFFALALCCSFSQKANAQWVVNDPAHMGMNAAEWATNVKNGLNKLMNGRCSEIA